MPLIMNVTIKIAKSCAKPAITPPLNISEQNVSTNHAIGYTNKPSKMLTPLMVQA